MARLILRSWRDGLIGRRDPSIALRTLHSSNTVCQPGGFGSSVVHDPIYRPCHASITVCQFEQSNC
jgi:hypothetical protein